MIGAFNLHNIQESVEGDLTGLSFYLQQIIGEPFLFFRESYGGEWAMHLGVPVERRSPKLKNRTRGSYVLTVRGSFWMLIARDKGTVVFSDLPAELRRAELEKLTPIDLEETPVVTPGAKLAWVTPYLDDLSGGIALALAFSDGGRFVIRPDLKPEDAAPEQGDLPEIADWELFTPINRCLTVGPGARWRYLAATTDGTN